MYIWTGTFGAHFSCTVYCAYSQIEIIRRLEWITMEIKRIFLIVLVFAAIGCIQQQSEAFRCVDVFDGDTFELENGDVIRLIGIDAPELTEPGGEIARDYLSRLILGRQVALVAGLEERDDYERLLRYVYIEDTCVNEEMIRNGYAEARYISKNDPNWSYYIQLEMEAEKRKVGLWDSRIFQPRCNPEWGDDIPVINWKEADQYYGQYVIIEGTIVDTYNSGKACFLNFHRDWEEYFTAVIFSCDFHAFPEQPEIYYLNRKVQIIGIIKEYEGSPEIIVKTSAQIRVIH
jgi:micrococcal nuclease